MSKKEMKKSTKLSIDLISTIIVTLIAGAVTVAAVISVAWFSLNRQVSTTGASVSVDAELFEIEVAENTATQRITSKLVSDGYSENTLVSDPSKNSIIGDIIIDSRDNYGQEEITIRPGAYGRIEFVILPKKDDLIFSISPLLAGNPSDPDYTELITDFEEHNSSNGAVTVDCGEALKLTYGHFLIFTGKSEESYSGRVILDGSIPIYIRGANTAGKEYKVTLYWVWPRTYGDLTSLVAEAELSANRDYYFKGNAPGPTSYNNGDQLIGDAFADLAILGTIDTVESIPEDAETVTVTASSIDP